MLAIASAYREGEYIKQDYEIELQWLQKAANHGNVKAYRAIGNYYANGRIGTNVDYEKAQDYFRKAVELGDTISERFIKSNPSPFGLEVTKSSISDFLQRFAEHNRVESSFTRTPSHTTVQALSHTAVLSLYFANSF
jgi:TPR repeat protein